MQILKDLCHQNRKWQPLEAYIARIEAYPDDGPLIVDNCKCIIESICKTILEDLKIPKENHKRKLPELAKQTAERIVSINKSPDLMEAFINMAFGIARFRNEYTETGHGQSTYVIDENRKIITVATIKYLTTIIEQTAIYIITIYQDEYPTYIQTRLRYEDSPEFNKDFDESFDSPIEISNFGPYSQSEVLFNIDKGAYISALAEFNNR